MTSMMAQQRTAAFMATTPHALLRRPLAYHRIDKRRHDYSRSLWWWSRHGTWPSSIDENLEDKMQKYQKIMRYRYSRALRRRAMWERDDSPPLWAARHSTKWFSQAWLPRPISTTSDKQARLKDETTTATRNDRTWEDAQNEFEAFKAEVDRAIAKDPVGFLFGRRLQGPLSTSNSSWTSFAKIFDSKESQETFEAPRTAQQGARKISIESTDRKQQALKPDTAEDLTDTSPRAQQQPSEEHEYVYDPVSGRKIPKSNNEPEEAQSFTERFFGSLFSEHRVEERQPPSDPKQHQKVVPGSRFENSMEHDYQKLRANTLGNNIDTTAEFGGKYEKPADDESERITDRSLPAQEIMDDAPPFSGTVYETTRGYRPTKYLNSKSWLENEGFREGATGRAQDSDNSLQPSLDRMQSRSSTPERKFITKLQPAIDRVSLSKPADVPKQASAPLNTTNAQGWPALEKKRKDDDSDKREDLDLLRASDIRAASRTARVTKNEVNRAKSEVRQKLEEDFTRLGRGSQQQLVAPDSTARLLNVLSRSNLDSVTKHVERYPGGIVAKTLQTINNTSEKFKSYTNPHASKVDLTQKLVINQDALSRLPSIYKGKDGAVLSKVPSVSPPEVTSLERAREVRIETIKNLNQEAETKATETSQHFNDLARAIREIYERGTGPIRPIADDESPLRTASVKPGVETYPYIERYTQEFEPKLVELREKAKGIKRNLFEINSSLEILREAKPADDLSNPTLSSSEHRVESYDATGSTDSTKRQLASDEKQRLSAMRALNDRIKREPNLLEKPVLRPRRPLPSDNGKTTIYATSDALQDQAVDIPTSPYVILTYNKQSGDVDATQLDTLIGQNNPGPQKANPIVVMSNLNYPAAFVAHFVTLEKAGYSLVSGGGDLLIFHKQHVDTGTEHASHEAFKTIKAIKADIHEIRNKIAVEEAKNQPQTDSKPGRPQKAATVLDEIPISVPPAGPTAASTTPSQSPSNEGEQKLLERKRDRKARTIRRQEQVFTGTIRPSGFKSENQTQTEANENASAHEVAAGEGLFRRFTRMVKRIVLTAIALGAGAYTIGIVTEGIGAHTQAVQGTEGVSGGMGPRKRVVMPQQPGAGTYNSESGRTG